MPSAGRGGDLAGALGLGDPLEQRQRLLAVAPLDEQLAEGDDGVLVAGLQLERLAQAGLVAGGEQRGDLALLLGRQQAVDEPLHLVLGVGADEPVDDLAVLAARTRRGSTARWNAWLIAGFSSTLTLASTTLPSVASTTFSMIGPSVLHGPHHGAHRSTTTGTVFDCSTTSVSNVASVTSTYGHDVHATERP